MDKHEINPAKNSSTNKAGAIVMMKCPTCKKVTPHHTKGVEKNAAFGGKLTQAMECTVCKTVSDVATGDGGRDFQANVDAPDGM